ncbi:MAG: HEAT repeat domain-containing protein [Dehalococcoidia bacterium]|nr:HEAT repeat domain-containing protein [Dehalococcoidia bacterium]
MASIDEMMGQLADSTKRLTKSQFAGLSDLSSSDAMRFKELWLGLGAVRRRHLITQLSSEAIANVQLNYDMVFTSCLSDPDEVVRATAIEGLWECQEPGLIGILISLLKKDSSVTVKKAAARALGVFVLLAEWGKIRPRYKEQLETSLLSVIKDDTLDSELRQRALESLSYLSHEEIIDIIKAAYQGTSKAMKVSALRSMGRNADSRWLDVLLKELSSSEADLRAEAALACGELGDEKAVLNLIKSTEDEDSRVQVAAIKALGQISGRRAVKALVALCKHTEMEIKKAAEEALREAQFVSDPMSSVI